MGMSIMILLSKRWIAYLLLSSTLLACGGGDDDNSDTNDDGGDSTNSSQDYSGETKQATLTSENVNELSSAAASGSKQAVSSDGVRKTQMRSDSPLTQGQLNEDLARLINETLNQAPQLAGRGISASRTEDLSSVICDTGSVVYNYPDDGLVGEWSIVYTQCSRSSGFGNNSYSSVLDGSVVGTYTRIGNGYQLSLSYNDFTVSVTHPGGSYSDTFNMQMTCSATTEDGVDVECDYYSDYEGYDGQVYRVSDVSVTGNGSSGYQVSVRVYHPDHGYVTVTTEVPVSFDCSGGYPNTGRVRVEGANGGLVLVEFTSCSQYVLVHDGVSEVFSWP
jgi:hypothetical protein